MIRGLTLEFQDESVVIDIENDSQGFDVEATLARRQDGAPFGLMGMRERVDSLNGTLSLNRSSERAPACERGC